MLWNFFFFFWKKYMQCFAPPWEQGMLCGYPITLQERKTAKKYLTPQPSANRAAIVLCSEGTSHLELPRTLLVVAFLLLLSPTRRQHFGELQADVSTFSVCRKTRRTPCRSSARHVRLWQISCSSRPPGDLSKTASTQVRALQRP